MYHQEPRIPISPQFEGSNDPFLDMQRQLIERGYAQELEDIASGNYRLQQQYQQDLDVYNNIINSLRGKISLEEQFRTTGKQTIDENTSALQQLLQGQVGQMNQAFDSNLSNLQSSFGQSAQVLPQYEQQLREGYATDPTFQTLSPEEQQAFLSKALEEVAFGQQQQQQEQSSVLSQLQNLIPEQEKALSGIPKSAPWLGGIANQTLTTGINENIAALSEQLQAAQLNEPLEPEYGNTNQAELRYDSSMLELMRQLASQQGQGQDERYRGLEGVMQYAQQAGLPNLASEYMNLLGTSKAEAMDSPNADDEELLYAAIMGYEPDLPSGVRSKYVQLLQILDAIYKGQYSNYES
jgi:hypothetical protein